MTTPTPQESAVPAARRVAEQRASAAKDARFVIAVDGREHTFRLGEMTASDVRALRDQAEMTVPDLVRPTYDHNALWDLAAAAAMVWMARRQAGEKGLTFAEVADNLRLDQLLVVRHEDDIEPVIDGPEIQRRDEVAD